MVFRDIGIDNTALFASAHTTLQDHLPKLKEEIRLADSRYKMEKILTWDEKSPLTGRERGELLVIIE